MSEDDDLVTAAEPVNCHIRFSDTPDHHREYGCPLNSTFFITTCFFSIPNIEREEIIYTPTPPHSELYDFVDDERKSLDEMHPC